MPFTVLVDGPNFINRLIQHNISKDDIKNMDFFQIIVNIQRILQNRGMGRSEFRGLEFYYSNKPRLACFEGRERTTFIKKLQKQQGITVYRIELSSSIGEEKALDSSIIVRMYEIFLSSNDILETVVLLSSDKDYVPPLTSLRKLGKYVVTVGYPDRTHSSILINHSYIFIPMNDILENALP